MGGCSHNEMKALYIASHYQAMRNPLKQVLHEQHAAHCLIAHPFCLEGLQQPEIHNKGFLAVILSDDK